MKKTIISILIIIVSCAICCVCVITLSGSGLKDSEEVTTSITTEEIPVSLQNAGEEAMVGNNIIQNTTTTELETEESTQEATTEFPDCFDLELELINQDPELPAGCESVSLTMILNYLGYDLDKTHIVDEYLVYSDNFVMGYCGDPYSNSTGGGCYAPGMTITANNFLKANGSVHTAYNITGTDFDTLLEYVAEGHPILIWTTINMADCSKANYNYDEEGNAYAWDYNEHCVVLAGYDFKAGTVTIYDPIDGVVYRDMENFKVTYEGMDEMAIIIK
ncbi:MAG: C39 family peptidase [Lachnospiraceae bacterium]|nr:C39 family peptidase [Lachnospiraceae bacterium]